MKCVELMLPQVTFIVIRYFCKFCHKVKHSAEIRFVSFYFVFCRRPGDIGISASFPGTSYILCTSCWHRSLPYVPMWGTYMRYWRYLREADYDLPQLYCIVCSFVFALYYYCDLYIHQMSGANLYYRYFSYTDASSNIVYSTLFATISSFVFKYCYHKEWLQYLVNHYLPEFQHKCYHNLYLRQNIIESNLFLTKLSTKWVDNTYLSKLFATTQFWMSLT